MITLTGHDLTLKQVKEVLFLKKKLLPQRKVCRLFKKAGRQSKKLSLSHV